jgi:hypothetical protein
MYAFARMTVIRHRAKRCAVQKNAPPDKTSFLIRRLIQEVRRIAMQACTTPNPTRLRHRVVLLAAHPQAEARASSSSSRGAAGA